MKYSKKTIFKACIQLIVCLFLVFMFQLQNVQAASPTKELTFTTKQEKWINPLCEDWRGEEAKSELEEATYILDSDKPADNEEYMSFEEAVEFYRGELKKREENIGPFNFYVQDSLVKDDDFGALLRKYAKEHTGVSTEGDTLIWEPSSGSSQCSYAYDGEYFWVKYEFFDLYYTSTAEQEAETITAIRKVMDELNLENMSEYDKIYTIYDYVCSHVAYDSENTSTGSGSEEEQNKAHSAYGAIVNGKAVCQGYAILTYRMLLEAGIDNRIVIGNGHTWNQVKYGDKYYNCDTTFDAYNPQNREADFQYFMCGISEYRRKGSHHKLYEADYMEQYPVPVYGYFSEENNVSYLPDEEISKGTCGDNLVWSLMGDGTLTISGTGPMYDYKKLESPWIDVRTRIKHIVVSEGVTGIGNYAFYDCYVAEDITISDTVTSIGNYAFSACDGIKSLYIPDSVTEIGTYVCEYCVRLQTIRFSSQIKEISDCFCQYCPELKEVELLSGVEAIGANAFRGCKKLQSIDIPGTVNVIKNGAFFDAFSDEANTIIILPEGIEEIQDNAFGVTRLREIVLPKSLRIIGVDAFSRMYRITSIVVPDTVTQIGDGAFGGCLRLQNVELQAGDATIGGGIFSRCTTLEEIDLPEQMTSIPSGMFAYDTALKNVHIPEGVATIGERAFSDSGITELKLPKSITTIEEYAFMRSKLTRVLFPSNLMTIKENAFFCCWDLEETIFTGDAPETVAQDAFDNTYTYLFYPDDNPTWTEEKLASYGRPDWWRGYTIGEDGHAWSPLSHEVPATCTEEGRKEQRCLLCEETNVLEVYPVKGHTYGEWETVIRPTETEEGLRQRKCSVCGDVDEEKIPVLGEIQKGDVDQDGTVDMKDLRLILKYVCEKTDFTEQQIQIADVTEDGVVDIKDLRQVLRYVCGKIEEL